MFTFNINWEIQWVCDPRNTFVKISNHHILTLCLIAWLSKHFITAYFRSVFACVKDTGLRKTMN